MGNKLLNDETLHNHMRSREDRPLIRLLSDPNDPEVLTPIGLLLMYFVPPFQPIEQEDVVDACRLTKRTYRASNCFV